MNGLCINTTIRPAGVQHTSLAPRLLWILGTLLVSACAAGPGDALEIRDIRDLREIQPDLVIPGVDEGLPAPGKRVKRVLEGFRDTEIYHVLYLPADWAPGEHYPVLAEYAGNGPYSNQYGDLSSGRPEGSKLGYGVSGGKGFIWVCLPYISSERTIQTRWWGDVEATLDYCRKVIRRVCEDFGGDHSAVFLCGFSRGAIGCGYLGLHDDAVADIWLGFVAYSHFDGVIDSWGYAGADRASARRRLRRIAGRASYLCGEPADPKHNVAATREYIEASRVPGAFTFRELSFRNHNDAWTLRPSEDRQHLRDWIARTLRDRPGTRSVRGRVTTADGAPLARVRVASGFNHFTFTDADGTYQLDGLIGDSRSVEASHPDQQFDPARRNVVLEGRNETDVDFVAR